MKSTLFTLGALSLPLLALSQPHRHGHAHVHKRGDIAYETVTEPAVVVWVYEDGKTASVESRTPVAAPTDQGNEVLANVVSSTAEAQPTVAPNQFYEEPAPEPQPAPAPEPELAPQAPAPASGLGICYSPYNGDGTCKSQDQVNSDFDKLSGYSLIRIYGVDCNQVTTVMSAARSKGKSVFAGILTINDVAGDLGSMIKQLNGDFSGISTISIGNELVDFGKAGVSDVVGALGVARGILGSAGYSGAIVTVDTFNALISHPELCTASDYCAANTHAYFDGTIEPSGAGAWVKKQVGRISDAAGGKRVVVTESGWPHGGQANGIAVPSYENQATAMQSVKDAFSTDLFLFSAFDDKWKADGGWGVEKNFGIM